MIQDILTVYTMYCNI